MHLPDGQPGVIKVLDHRLAEDGPDAPVGVGQRVRVRHHVHVRERADVHIGEGPAAARPASDRQADGPLGLPGQDPVGGVHRRLGPVIADPRLAAPIDQAAQQPQDRRAT